MVVVQRAILSISIRHLLDVVLVLVTLNKYFYLTEQEVLYTEFLKLSVPFLTLGLKGFTKFMKLLGWSEEECKHLFRYLSNYEYFS